MTSVKKILAGFTVLLLASATCLRLNGDSFDPLYVYRAVFFGALSCAVVFISRRRS